MATLNTLSGLSDKCSSLNGDIVCSAKNERRGEAISIHSLKPRFQQLLRPLVAVLARAGVTANLVTIAAMVLSVAIGVLLSQTNTRREWFALIPTWFLARMAFNAIDGMLAREHGQKSRLGAYLNELSDVVSDAALYAPFAFVAPFSMEWLCAVTVFAALSETAGILGQTVGASRRYDGPMGKSDRALVFGCIGLWVALSGQLPPWFAWVMPTLVVAIGITVVNRIRAGLAEAEKTK